MSKVIVLEDEESFIVSRIFLRVPFEYGFNGPVGKKYEAIKDFLKWNELSVKYWTPILLTMSDIWITNRKK